MSWLRLTSLKVTLVIMWKYRFIEKLIKDLKLKRAYSSIEALLKRVSNNKLIGSINPIVDIYNAASLLTSWSGGQ